MIESRSLRTRREQIARELDDVERQMSALVRRMELEARARMNPVSILRRHPVGAFVGSTVAGVAFSMILGKRESGGIIKKTLRAIASRWIARQVMQYLSKKQQ